MSPRLAFALRAATEAGKSTLAHFQNGVGFVQKADASPLTIADTGAERLIREAIARDFPGESILGEEEGLTGGGDDRWVIDPIDGTKSFIAGVPLYATLLSYEVAGRPVVGVSYFPVFDLIVYAERGLGAFANGRPIQVSPVDELSKATFCVGGHKSVSQRGLTSAIEALSLKCMATRTWCDAYGHCLVAMGQVQGMIDPIVAPHDISAIEVIIEEAGGVFTGVDGGPAVDSALSAGALHSVVLEALRG